MSSLLFVPDRETQNRVVGKRVSLTGVGGRSSIEAVFIGEEKFDTVKEAAAHIGRSVSFIKAKIHSSDEHYRAVYKKTKFRRVSIDGVIYESAASAKEILGLEIETSVIRSRLRSKSSRFSDWFYVD